MANRIRLKNPQTGVVKDGFYGFSWTTLFFCGFPALFRGDILIGLGVEIFSLVVGIFTLGLGTLVVSIVWAFIYNKRYTVGLLEKGYEFDDVPQRVQDAKLALKIV